MTELFKYIQIYWGLHVSAQKYDFLKKKKIKKR